VFGDLSSAAPICAIVLAIGWKAVEIILNCTVVD
jgi:hypothetical protein